MGRTTRGFLVSPFGVLTLAALAAIAVTLTLLRVLG
jgi:hypothetical protein